jgi:glycosyltransferase involved in cell wall biosynthesis
MYDKSRGNIRIMKKWLVSIIVPVYNVENYVGECIESIKNQTYSNIEVIVVNDGSEDRSIEIINDMIRDDSRFTIINQKNQGLSVARNNGLKYAKGDYFFFVDSDDYIEKNCIEELLNLICKYDVNMCIAGTTLLVGDAPKRMIPNYSGQVDSEKIINDFIYGKNGMIHSAWGKLFKKNIKNQLIFPSGRLYEDQFVIYDVVKNNSCTVCNSTTYIYRIRENSIITSKSNIDKKTMDMMDSIKTVQAVLKDMCNLNNALRYKVINDSLQIIKYCLVGKTKNQAYEYAIQNIISSNIKDLKKYKMSLSHIVQILMIKYCMPLFKVVYIIGRK